MQKALATLPWVEQGTEKMDFKARELRFRLKAGAKFDEEGLKAALKDQNFNNVEVRSRPA